MEENDPVERAVIVPGRGAESSSSLSGSGWLVSCVEAVGPPV